MESSAFAERVLGEVAAGTGCLLLCVGHKLGLFHVMRDMGRASIEQIAQRAQCHPRYIKEWLEACTVYGYIKYDSVSSEFWLPEGHAIALCDSNNSDYVAPFTQWIPSVSSPAVMSLLLQSFRQGGGVPFPMYGQDGLDAIAQGNKPMFFNEYVQVWLPTLPDIHAQLQSGNARVLEIGCGLGYSTIALAKGFSQVPIVLDAVDIDEDSIRQAKQLAQEYQVADKISFLCCDAADLLQGEDSRQHSYDLVTLFECLHDISRPLDVLRLMHQFVKPNGAVLIADERVEDKLEDMLPDSADGSVAKFSDNEKNFRGRLNYGFSVLHCLPQSMACGPHSAAIGTVIRPSYIADLSREAGFARCQVVHENAFWRFYRLDRE
eukprot:TRINITY_DN2348_c0_g1_i4.p1 TRINITY_DN2348_c0_g1~~TRINITY_DN2348_c0_g1_i4.p1  ORF type:complete len:377 (-),score=90.48 TRINITY_DN2348_c0_g1_i4:71-1201(-)